MLLWFCADVCGRWLVHMKIQTSCNGFYGDVYKGYRTSHNECLCIFSVGASLSEQLPSTPARCQKDFCQIYGDIQRISPFESKKERVLSGC